VQCCCDAGFSAADIEEKTEDEDKYLDKVLGWCYRLRIRSKNVSHQKEYVRESKKAKVSVGSAEGEPKAEGQLAIEVWALCLG
jgi:hypothetical protein